MWKTPGSWMASLCCRIKVGVAASAGWPSDLCSRKSALVSCKERRKLTAPSCKQSVAATELRSSSSGRASQSPSRVGHEDSVISAQHGTALWTLFLVALPVRLLLGFSEPQYSLMLSLPNSSSLAPPFTGIGCELWAQGCLYYSWSSSSVPFTGAISL